MLAPAVLSAISIAESALFLILAYGKMKWFGILIILFVSVFVLVGLWLIRDGWRNLQLARQSRDWPSAEATVESSDISRHGGRGGPKYQVAVIYSYSVGGVPHRGSTLHPGYDHGGEESARLLAEKLRAGTVIKVHYHPATPGISTIVPGEVRATIFPLIGGVMFFVLGCGFLTLIIAGVYFPVDFAGLVQVLKRA